jgi:hypothetical protein
MFGVRGRSAHWCMGNACGSNVKDKLEEGKLQLLLSGWPADAAPPGDLDGPFRIGAPRSRNSQGWAKFWPTSGL